MNEVKEHRTAEGLTQEDLARELGVSRQSIISIERGRYTPSLMLAFRMAAFFGCTVDDLFRRKGGKRGR
ncbi:MAG: helix-turn-helix transcriptional regulator [Candidatus Eisenbacteria bacterium]